MALFQRKPKTDTLAPLYSLGLNKTILVVGLGNKGKEYTGTRHNIGFECVDYFVKTSELSDWTAKKDHKCLQSSGTLGDTHVIVIKPTTYMNLSGEAVQATANFYKIPPSNIVVVHDELDIPFGQIRTRIGGSDAGNNGIKSVTEHIGESYGRVRIGIKATSPMDSADFVLSKFTAKEQKQLPNLLKETTAVLSEYIYGSQLPHDTRNFIV